MERLSQGQGSKTCSLGVFNALFEMCIASFIGRYTLMIHIFFVQVIKDYFNLSLVCLQSTIDHFSLTLFRLCTAYVIARKVCELKALAIHHP